MIITSPANERLKHARRVRDGREDDLLFIEGERLIEECLSADLPLHTCFRVPDLTPRGESIIRELESRRCPVYTTVDDVLATLSDTVNTQGLIVLAGRRTYDLNESISARDDSAPLLVGLDQVQDPGNLGTIVRTAEAAGVGGIFVIKGSVDPFAPKTLRSAMGSAFRMPILTDLAAGDMLDRAKLFGIKVIVTESGAPDIYSDFDLTQPVLIVFGNEARGVGQELLERSDARLRIPICEPVESLNVSAAAAAVLFEAVRQRRANRRDDGNI